MKRQWINENGDLIVTNGERPTTKGTWYPVYPASRIHGDKYTPYDGVTDWEKDANHYMALAAGDNFRK